MTYAYARISSRDQNLDRQLSAFRSFGIPPKHIFCDKKSGKDFERKNYLRLIRKLKCGDLLVIKSIDRLGRSYDLIIEEWSRITNKILADILLLDMPLLDTRAKPCSLVGKFISDIVLQVLSFVAENERENTRARQAEGIAEAKRKGVRFGRPPFRYSQSFLETAENYYRKSVNLSTIQTTFKRLFPEHHPHELRYTFITRAKEAGCNLEAVMLWAGHSFDKDVKTSAVDRGYTDYSKEYILSEAEKVNYDL